MSFRGADAAQMVLDNFEVHVADVKVGTRVTVGIRKHAGKKDINVRGHFLVEILAVQAFFYYHFKVLFNALTDVTLPVVLQLVPRLLEIFFQVEHAARVNLPDHAVY